MATFPKDDIKKILDSIMKADFSKVAKKNVYLMGIVRRVRNEATGKVTKMEEEEEEVAK